MVQEPFSNFSARDLSLCTTGSRHNDTRAIEGRQGNPSARLRLVYTVIAGSSYNALEELDAKG